MESLQFVGCSWFIGLIGLGFRFTQNKSTSTELCALPCPFSVSSSTHLDAPGVPSAAGYVAIPPHALSDPDSREFSDSLLFESTDTVTGPELELHLPFTCAPHALNYGRPRQAPVYLASRTYGHCRKSMTGLREASSQRLQFFAEHSATEFTARPYIQSTPMYRSHHSTQHPHPPTGCTGTTIVSENPDEPLLHV
jgi:hypothetical protein